MMSEFEPNPVTKAESVNEANPPVVPEPAAEVTNRTDAGHWHAEAGRKGARRRHQLIQAGRLYEKEHGLTKGRQRVRQLIEQGKLYEQEHGLHPTRQRRGRLSRAERDNLLATLLRCLTRLAKPSFRGELIRLVESLPPEESRRAA